MQDPIRVLTRDADPLLAAGVCVALSSPGLVELDSGADADVLIADYDGALAQISCRDGEAEIRLALQKRARGYLLSHCGVDELVAAAHGRGEATAIAEQRRLLGPRLALAA